MVPKWIENFWRGVISPLVNWSIKNRVDPNFFTTLGFVLTIFGAVHLACGFIFWGGFWILMAGTCDMIDGKIARETGQVTKFGALYDSVLDRYSEFVMFVGIGAYYYVQGVPDYSANPEVKECLIAVEVFLRLNSGVLTKMPLTLIATVLAVGGSLMVSYTRARAEGLGLECKVGWLQRPERVLLIGFGCLLSVIWYDFDDEIYNVEYPLIIGIWLIAIFSNITAWQRLNHVKKNYKE